MRRVPRVPRVTRPEWLTMPRHHAFLLGVDVGDHVYMDLVNIEGHGHCIVVIPSGVVPENPKHKCELLRKVMPNNHPYVRLRANGLMTIMIGYDSELEALLLSDGRSVRGIAYRVKK